MEVERIFADYSRANDMVSFGKLVAGLLSMLYRRDAYREESASQMKVICRRYPWYCYVVRHTWSYGSR